jgi:hypothetical protein
MKEQPVSMARDLARGILSPRNIQVSLSDCTICLMALKFQHSNPGKHVQTCMYLLDLDFYF